VPSRGEEERRELPSYSNTRPQPRKYFSPHDRRLHSPAVSSLLLSPIRARKKGKCFILPLLKNSIRVTVDSFYFAGMEKNAFAWWSEKFERIIKGCLCLGCFMRVV
jgi:hypothetical protein